MDEAGFDAVGGEEAAEIFGGEDVELFRVLGGEQDDVAGAEVVADGILGGGFLALLGDGAFGFGSVVVGGFGLFV